LIFVVAHYFFLFLLVSILLLYALRNKKCGKSVGESRQNALCSMLILFVSFVGVKGFLFPSGGNAFFSCFFSAGAYSLNNDVRIPRVDGVYARDIPTSWHLKEIILKVYRIGGKERPRKMRK
jgi:hypothetical protein